MQATWPSDGGRRHRRYVVCTGGEPLLQLDAAAVEALHAAGFEVAVETNGTQPAPPGLDWICVSPKAGAPLVLRAGDELKLVYPQPERDAGALSGGWRSTIASCSRWTGPKRPANTAAAAAYCLAHPDWRLSLQTHKLIGLP